MMQVTSAAAVQFSGRFLAPRYTAAPHTVSRVHNFMMRFHIFLGKLDKKGMKISRTNFAPKKIK